MHIYEELKSGLNGTLEIALGIEKINTMIYPKKAHTSGTNLVNLVYKELQQLSNLSKNRFQNPVKTFIKDSQKPTQTQKSVPTPQIRPSNFKKNLSISIKTTNSRLQQSRAGKKIVGQVLENQNLSFNSSFEKTLTSRSGTPKPTSLPFVSFRTGKVEKSIKLPSFSDYLEEKGSNYMKTKYNDEIFQRLDRASVKITKFAEEFDSKALTMVKNLEEHSKRFSMRMPQFSFENKNPVRANKRASVFVQPVKKSPVKRMNQTLPAFFDTIQGFNHTRLQENQKFLDIIDKIEMERPLIVRQKVDLIQKDTERFRNKMHSLKKFENFRTTVESSRRARQSSSVHQGKVYMSVIEGFRLQRYKPSAGEMEILEFWKKMVELGWVVTKNDLDELRFTLLAKGLSSLAADSLLNKLQKSLFPNLIYS